MEGDHMLTGSFPQIGIVLCEERRIILLIKSGLKLQSASFDN